MKIIRFLDGRDNLRHGALQPDGSARLLPGDLSGRLEVTDQVAEVKTLLAPILPTQILAIGLNYRRHAEEVGAKIPEFPIVFIKSLNTVQNPGGTIVIPKSLKSDQAATGKPPHRFGQPIPRNLYIIFIFS